MPRCPNCGQETARTEDWACQWCGYPLLSNAYKKIPKTYRQLKEERRKERPPDLGGGIEEPQPPESTPAPAATVLESKPPAAETEPEEVPEPEPVAEAESDVESEAVTEPEMEPASEPEVTEPEEAVAIEPGPQSVTGLEEKLATGVVAVTVDELNSVFKADRAATEVRLKDKVLSVKGILGKVFVRSEFNIQYLILTGSGKRGAWSVRCTFGKDLGLMLNKLKEGQTVTVQGSYAGYRKNIILKDCALVS